MRDETEPKRVKGSGVKFAYETLRDEILSLALDPGAVLDETSLAERFGMSRSPVREALIRLAGDDLVVTLSNRSTVVAPIDLRSFPKYVEALDVAQRMNTRLAAELRTDLDLKTDVYKRQPHVRAGVAGRGQQAERPRRARAGFRTQPSPQPVIHRVQVVQLLGHGRTGDVQHPPGDHPPDLAFAVNVHSLYRPVPAHRVPLRTCLLYTSRCV